MKFVCDVMLGKLAKYLRILGLDAPSVAGTEGRGPSGEAHYFLTRRTALKESRDVIFIRSDRARDQVMEIAPIIRPFIDPRAAMTRCIACNVPLEDIPRVEVERHVPEFVYHTYEVFIRCPLCGKIYWEGSHTARMAGFIKEVLRDEEME